ncbi:MAG: hypothetical protein ABW134_15455 [Candidatus Thiodiazotropha endolucinida]
MESTILKEIISAFDLPNISLAIALLALYAYKRLKEHLVRKRRRKIETLQHLMDFYKNYTGEKREFLVEQLFYNHFGKLLSYPEIQFLLRFQKPSLFIQQYVQARQFVEISDDGEGIRLKNKYKSIYREIIKGFSWYGIYGCVALMLLFQAYGAFLAIGPKIYAPWITLTLALFALAGIYMSSAINALSAKSMLKECNEKQNKLQPADAAADL